jgi:hypothetical protein
MQEIAGLGYINDERRHCLISVREPSLATCGRCDLVGKEMIQITISIETACELRAKLNHFLAKHGSIANSH